MLRVRALTAINKELQPIKIDLTAIKTQSINTKHLTTIKTKPINTQLEQINNTLQDLSKESKKWKLSLKKKRKS